MSVPGRASEGTHSLLLGGPFALESGRSLPEVRVAYRTWGRLAPAGDNAVLVCHALTGSADVHEWWAPLLGPRRALDPERDFVVCSNVLGGCYGSTGPCSRAPGAARPYGPDFPEISVRDMVHVQAALLEALGVGRLRLVLGGSLGGMQVLEWAALYPERVHAIAPIAVSARHSAWCIGLSEAQRQALFADPRFKGGRYAPDDPPATGLAAARMLAMCTYRSRASLEQRFGRARAGERAFAVESWLSRHGQRLAARFDANAYVALTRAMDGHDLGRGRGALADVLGRLDLPALVVAIDSDVLYPPEEQAALAVGLRQGRLAWLRSSHGHDAFLIEAEALNELLLEFRAAQGQTQHVGLVRERLGRLPAGVVPVVTGFVAATAAGHTTTLGRGGSDLSAALLGYALAAERVEIWSDVDGVMSADPRRDPEAVTLPRLSYAEAGELARKGAKVLQPESVAPLERAGIPILVRNTLRPHGPSTWIGAQAAPRVDIALAGFRGQVARSLLSRLAQPEPGRVELRLVTAFQRERVLRDPQGLSPRALLGSGLAAETLPWRATLAGLRAQRLAPLVLVDCTASAELAREYAGLLGDGVAVVTPNKHAGCLPFAEYDALRSGSRAGVPWRYATTVGAGLPVLRTLREQKLAGDHLTSLAAVLSGTLSFVLERVQRGLAFSQAVAEARQRGLTEPDPREDLAGEDVARKLLIALREAGLPIERAEIAVESLVPPGGLSGSVDAAWAERAVEARVAGRRLAHVARWDSLGPRVGVEALPESDPLARVAAGENVIVIHSERYAQVPLRLSGPGAGPDVTARGVLADLLLAAEELIQGDARAAQAAVWGEAWPNGACY